MEKREKIKEKIKALLSKTTDNGASLAEMEPALSKATELMIAFFISEKDLETAEAEQKCISETIPLVETGYDLSLFYADLAQLFDCEHFYTKSKITFFGYKEDVGLAVYFYQYIARLCLKEKDIFTKTERYKHLNTYIHGKTLAASFIQGFLLSVVRKIQELYIAREKEVSDQCNSLVLVTKKDQVKKQFRELNITLKISNPKVIRAEKAAFDQGITEGEKVQLTQGLRQEKKEKDTLLLS